ncbi:MAG TPA: TIR domain-containing protein [Vicinamibacterales bacterium]|nr:TIR domain-containing protein [Vicinamibacterales bacterium]
MPGRPPARVRVFISAKSGDYDYAEAVYRHLTAAGIAAFFSRESLPEVGSADYRREIDRALDEADHLVVVTSSIDSVVAPWVEAEWGFFINEKRSGRKTGNLITVLAGAMRPADLPPSLRYYEAIPFDAAALDTLLRYVRGPLAGVVEAEASTPARVAPPGRGFREVATFAGPPGLDIMRVSPAIIAAGGLDGAVRVYDAATRARSAVLGSALYWTAGHDAPITALEFSLDGARLAAGHLDGRVHVWDLGGRQELGDGLAHDLAISGLAWSIDGRTLTTSSKEGVIKRWDVGSPLDGRPAGVQRSPAPVVSMVTVPGTGWLALGLINMATRRYVIQVQNGEAPYDVLATAAVPESFTTLTMSGDARLLAAASQTGAVRLYDFDAVADAIRQRKTPRSLAPLLDLRGHDSPIVSVAFLPDARRVVTCANEVQLIVWDVQTGKPSVTLRGQDGEQFAGAAALNDTTLVAGLADGRLRCWQEGPAR